MLRTRAPGHTGRRSAPTPLDLIGGPTLEGNADVVQVFRPK
jgi:hypothetical protein